MREDRAALRVAGWFATAIASGIVAAWLLRPAPTERILWRDRPVPAAAREDPGGAPGPGAESGRTPEGNGATDGSSPGSGSSTTAGTSGLAVAWFLVSTVDDDGAPVRPSMVYALPAGSPGVDDDPDLCEGTEDADGRSRIPLPRAGPYDVGGWVRDADINAYALAVDVPAEEGRTIEVTLRLPKVARFQFEPEGDWWEQEDVRSRKLRPFVAIHGSKDRVRWCPGRGDDFSVDTGVWLGGPPPWQSAPLPADREFEITPSVIERRQREGESFQEVESGEFRLAPSASRGRPGDTIRLRRVPAGTLEVTLRHAELDACWPPWGPHGKFSLEHRGGRTERSHGWSYPNEIEHASPILVTGAPGPAVFRWGGPGIVPGVLEDVRLEEGQTTRVEVELKPQAPEGGPLEVVCEGLPPGPGGSPATVELSMLLAEHAAGRVVSASVPAAGGEPLNAWWRTGASIVATCGDALATDPVRPPSSGPLVLRFRPAGWLLVAPEAIPEEGLGDLQIRARDRRPIPVRGDDAGADWMGVEAGMLLGPLPEGEYGFQARLGATALADVAGVVKAGRVEVLRIGTRSR